MKKVQHAEIDKIIARHIQWKHSRSGGHGGQNVNKRETKAEGYFDILGCTVLNEEQKEWLYDKYHNHVSKKGVLRLTCQEQRNYHQNLEILKKHFKILLDCLGEEILFDRVHHRRHKKRH